MTTPSPSTVGSTATRMSRRRPAAFAFSEMRPSCGLRRSAMSSLASTFRRVVTPGASRFGMRWSSCRTPSTRERTTSASSCGSKWMSLAPSSAAWRMIELTRRTSGASETPSSASRSSPSSSSSSPRSNSSSTRAARSHASAALLEPLELELDLLRRARPRSRACSAWRGAARRSPGRSWDRRWRCGGGRRRSGTGRPRRARARAWGSPRRPASGRRSNRGRRRGGGAPRRAARAFSGRSWPATRCAGPGRAAPALGVRPSSMIACGQRAHARARAREGEPVERDQARRLEQVGDELGDRVRRDARAGRVLGLDARRLLTVVCAGPS